MLYLPVKIREKKPEKSIGLGIVVHVSLNETKITKFGEVSL